MRKLSTGYWWALGRTAGRRRLLVLVTHFDERDTLPEAGVRTLLMTDDEARDLGRALIGWADGHGE